MVPRDANDRMSHHPDLTIAGELVTFGHLEPVRLVCPVAMLGRDLAIDVRFANHCYSAEFDPAVHDPAWTIMDGRRRRAFDRGRYEASHRLPAMVAALPTVSVWQTRQERNFVYFVISDDGTGHDSPMFFNAKWGETAHVALFVESAHPKSKDVLKAQVAEASRKRHPLICTNVVQRQPL